MIGRGKLFLNSRVEKLLCYVAITRASGFRLSLLKSCVVCDNTQIELNLDVLTGGMRKPMDLDPVLMRDSQNAPAHLDLDLLAPEHPIIRFKICDHFGFMRKNLRRSGVLRDYSSFTPSIGLDPAYPFDGYL